MLALKETLRLSRSNHVKGVDAHGLGEDTKSGYFSGVSQLQLSTSGGLVLFNLQTYGDSKLPYEYWPTHSVCT